MTRLLVLLLVAACSPAVPTAPRPAAPPPSSEAPRLDARALARQIHDAANDARRRAGRAPLPWADRLARPAVAHSRDMARRGFFDHVNPDGESANDRAERLGVSCRVTLGAGRSRVGVLENLYQTWRYTAWRETRRGDRTSRVYDWQSADQITAAVVRGWLGSPGHRRNLLDGDARTQAVGVAVADDDAVYVTQILC